MNRGFLGLRIGFAWVAGLAVAACSGSSSDAALKCVPGETNVCACGGAPPGVQRCAGDGTYLPCTCEGSEDAGGGKGDRDSSADSGKDGGSKGHDAGSEKDAGTTDGAHKDAAEKDGESKDVTVADGDTVSEGSAQTDSGEGGVPFDGCAVASSEAVDGDQYVVQTNEWNSTLPQCLSVSGTGFTVTEADFDLMTAGPPATYPSIYKGCHWGDCSSSASSGMPILASSSPTVTSSWSTTQPASGAYDVAYDIWFNTTPTATGQPDGAELMIWIAETGGASPAGTLVDVASIAGATWNVWVAPMASWTYIAYERTPTTTSVTDLNITAFINDAVTRGVIEPSYYLIDVEAGFEIWQGGEGLATSSFSVDVGPPANVTCPAGSFSASCQDIACSSTLLSAECKETNGTLVSTELALPCSAAISNCDGQLFCGSCPATATTCPLAGKALTMIDDGSESGTVAGILQQCGRIGYWYTFQDPTSTQTPPSGTNFPISTLNPPNGVTGYVETYGTLSNAAYYGAGAGFSFNDPSGTDENYDVTQYSYTGVSFWIMTPYAPSVQPSILFHVLDGETGPLDNGQYYFQVQLPAPPAGVWTKYSYTWSQLHQPIATETSLDLKEIQDLQWEFNGTSPGTDTPQPFDISIGDVEFLQ